MIELMSKLSKLIGNIQQHPIRAHDTTVKQDIKYLLICMHNSPWSYSCVGGFM